jgi:hypothetical protein
MLGRQGPAPLDMPNDTALFGTDPRVTKLASSVTIGASSVG